MLHLFGLDRLAVVVGDLHFLDPNPDAGQDGAEQGVRLELRLLEADPLRGSIYSAVPIRVDQPLWRVDVLESVDNPGSFDRAHHHPRFRGWEPGRRHFVDALTADPLGWLAGRLADPAGVLADAGVEPGLVPEEDVDGLAVLGPQIVEVVRGLLDGVRAGRLGQPPANPEVSALRAGWL